VILFVQLSHILQRLKVILVSSLGGSFGIQQLVLFQKEQRQQRQPNPRE